MALMIVLYMLTKLELKEHIREDATHTLAEKNLNSVLIGITLGLVVLLLSSKLVVWSAVSIAGYVGVSDLIIGSNYCSFGHKFT